MVEKKWLSLTKAAELLEIHPTTLRRWADSGAIDAMVTPGGHRRFSSEVLDAFVAKRGTSRDVESKWAEHALTHTRREIAARPQMTGLQQSSAEMRTTFRSLGQRLVGVAMRYMAAEDSDDVIPDEAREIGRAYGRLGLENGMPLTEILSASLFFHEQMLESSLNMADNNRIRNQTDLRVLQRTNKLLNTIHLSIAEVYEAQV